MRSTTGLQNAGATSGTHLCTTTNTNTTCTYEVRAVVGIYASGPSNQATAAALTGHVPMAVIGLPNDAGIGWPFMRVNSGLGSNRSRWLGPPSMNSQMTDFAVGL